MLGSPGEPIIIAGRICYPANFSASATVRRTFAHTLVQYLWVIFESRMFGGSVKRTVAFECSPALGSVN